ncbi:hypothetical protein [Ramlibacter sp.]|uniref:hypothetical protein n=1 Tax=Ramlibacter sp. TaxID=1917967 RepID=UPI001823B35B|nr:hypothetical protein [Ramlibacter sp.]MBA2672769.1 hypothetical protein [Ramlibacter sp.]
MDIALNFINDSNDAGNAKIVIYTHNALGGIDEMPVAWKVIANCAPGSSVGFVYPHAVMVGANDEAGHQTPPQPAEPGQLFAMRQTGSGWQLTQAGQAGKPDRIEILHQQGDGPIGASIYKDGRLLATRQTIMPRNTAVFRFAPVLWIGAAARVEEGRVIHRAVQAGITTRLSLQGIASADIAMTGGGSGPHAQPVQFALRNATMA